MKKTLLLAAALGVINSAQADEGMWTLYNLPDAVYEMMTSEGFNLPCDQLFNAPNAISNSVVNFSGYCSGVVVSPNGLVFTNHHCGFSAINSHSTTEHDYMLNGFYAKDYSEELPNENMFVSFMKDQQDITSRVNAALAANTDKSADEVIDSLNQVMTDSVKNIDGTFHVEIDAFYEGNKYYATTYQEFRDVRLVFTLPKSMGKFGGETDNWMWPRQTCDFSVFRIYADPKTNGPADYSEENVPYHPKSWAPVSLQGYKDGDFSMTVGYPGSTSRYLSSYGIKERRDVDNSIRVQARDIKLALLKKYMDQSEKTRIQYEDQYVGCANYWKNSMGMNKCIDSIGLIRQKAEYEAKIKQWLSTHDSADTTVNVDFQSLESMYANRAEAKRTITYWNESFWKSTELFKRAFNILTGKISPETDDKGKQYFEFKDNSDEWNLALDKEMSAAMLKNFKENVPSKYWPAVFSEVDKKYKGDFAKYINDVYKKSALLKQGAKINAEDIAAYVTTQAKIKDPGLQLCAELFFDTYVKAVNDFGPYDQAVDAQEKKLCEAKIQMEMDLPHYSDANFTMRLSYGQVGGYLIGGYQSGYYTDAASIVKKMEKGNEVEDYKAEPVMKELLSVNDYGKYQDKTTGKMQLCFLTNNDITGGNSGSPMFDGNGRLIGLAFDGNWDSLSSDINFDKKLARCIGVDIRYVLYMMDKWGHADRLINEISPIE